MKMPGRSTVSTTTHPIESFPAREARDFSLSSHNRKNIFFHIKEPNTSSSNRSSLHSFIHSIHHHVHHHSCCSLSSIAAPCCTKSKFICLFCCCCCWMDGGDGKTPPTNRIVIRNASRKIPFDALHIAHRWNLVVATLDHVCGPSYMLTKSSLSSHTSHSLYPHRHVCCQHHYQHHHQLPPV